LTFCVIIFDFEKDDNMRGRKPLPIEGIGDYCFEKLSKATRNARERIRYLAFAHLQDGRNFTEAALMVKVKLRTLMKWVKRFKESGIDGLKDQPGRGKKPHLPNEYFEAFRQSVLELQANRSGGRIKGKDVLELMQKKFGISPSRSSVYDTLKRAELVWITGRSQHPKSDPELQEAFKKTSKKK
jgi:putative transposase